MDWMSRDMRRNKYLQTKHLPCRESAKMKNDGDKVQQSDVIGFTVIGSVGILDLQWGALLSSPAKILGKDNWY